jgi:hypothetical protein
LMHGFVKQLAVLWKQSRADAFSPDFSHSERGVSVV